MEGVHPPPSAFAPWSSRHLVDCSHAPHRLPARLTIFLYLRLREHPQDDLDPLAGPFLYVTGSCNQTGLHDPIPLYGDYHILHTDSTLAVWGCYSEQDQAYHIYLRGHDIYEAEIGNISCSFSQIQPAIFPVTYQSSKNVFSTQEPVTDSATPSEFFSNSIYSAINSLWYLVIMAQNALNNQIAESVKDLGIQALWLQPPNDRYMPLYEAMLQGMLMDIVCTSANNSSLSYSWPFCSLHTHGFNIQWDSSRRRLHLVFEQ